MLREKKVLSVLRKYKHLKRTSGKAASQLGTSIGNDEQVRIPSIPLLQQYICGEYAH